MISMPKTYPSAGASACQSGPAWETLMFEARGKSPKAKGGARGALLRWAAKRGSLGMAKLALKLGAKTDAKDAIGATPLWWASGADDAAPSLLLLLREAKADLEAPCKGSTPLMRACAMDRPDMAEALFGLGSNLHARDGNGLDSLMLSCIVDSEECVATLILLGADPMKLDANGRGALSHAAEHGRIACMHALEEKLATGAESQQDAQGKSPADWARDSKVPEARRWLVGFAARKKLRAGIPQKSDDAVAGFGGAARGAKAESWDH